MDLGGCAAPFIVGLERESEEHQVQSQTLGFIFDVHVWASGHSVPCGQILSRYLGRKQTTVGGTEPTRFKKKDTHGIRSRIALASVFGPGIHEILIGL
jgi:hypothetical protein